MPPGFCRIGSTGESPLVTTVETAKVWTSATSNVHGGVTGAAPAERGVPPVPGCRRNAIFFPSGDHAGMESREVDGAMNRMGWSCVYRPIKLCSVRLDTNARVRPSGDHVGDSLELRAKNSICAG